MKLNNVTERDIEVKILETRIMGCEWMLVIWRVGSFFLPENPVSFISSDSGNSLSVSWLSSSASCCVSPNGPFGVSALVGGIFGRLGAEN